MSFGYSVGDVIAILQLFERVALEVRSYRNAPQHFQQLAAELQLVQQTLRRLLQLEPTCEDEKQQLEHIRAIAIHCHQPVQAFINKMRGSEKSLGHFRPPTTLSTIGRRLHWSLITKNDVDDLRKVIMSEMIAINMLLGLQQLSSLKRIKVGEDFATSSEVKQFCTQSQNFFATSSLIFKDLESLPAHITGLQTQVAEHTFRQNHTSTQVIEHLDAVSSQSRALVSQGTCTVACLGRLENQISRSISALISIARDIKEILCRLRTFSKDFSDMITANGRKLLDMHAMMKSLVRAVEVIPLHLTLPIVRLDDALGESWALPYQACQTLSGFNEILRSVVFASGRPGSGRVELGQFVIRTINNGAPLNSHTWTFAVKEGAHLTQAMVLSGTKNDLRKCFVSDCSGHLQSNGNCCDLCGRTSSSEINTISPLRTTPSQLDNPALRPTMQRNRGRGAFAPMLPGKFDWERDEIRNFRNVHLVENRPPIASAEEAERILEREPLDSNASHYLGWHLLCSRKGSADTVEKAIFWLQRSLSNDGPQRESYYLLGRAFMELEQVTQPQVTQAYTAYQSALYIDGRCPTFWLSVGLLYCRVKQYRDCLDAFSRAIRLNPYVPLAWRNLGVLYEISNEQERDAIDAYTRAFDCGLDDSQCQDRLNALQDHALYGTDPPPLSIQMEDFDLRTATYDVYELGQHNEIEIAGLSLENESDGAESETASDDWQITSDDESDVEGY